MAITIQTKSECRIVPLRFARATQGEPDSRYPDIDERGHANSIPAVNGLPTSDPIGGAVLPMAANTEVHINMIREDIDNSAVLFVSSSDSTALTILSPGSGEKCSAGPACTLTLKANHIAGSTPKLVFVEIRFGKANGPIIAKLATYIFPILLVKVQAYCVTVDDNIGNTGRCPTLNVAKVMQKAQAIWCHYGVELAFAKLKNITVKLNQKDHMELAEINQLYKADWTSQHINIYFVQQMEGQNILGYGFTPQDYAGYAFPVGDGGNGVALRHPGIFVAMQTAGLERSNDTHLCAHIIAQEIGRFLTLPYQSSALSTSVASCDQKDTWSRRLLMYKLNDPTSRSAPQSAENWPNYNEFGYGNTEQVTHPGCLITLKSLQTSATVGADGHCSMARNHISKGISTLY
jgi:hypothetical protein